ncbi:MAG: JAB domain-containing protein [Oscillospiraceae bacterium]
MESIESKVEAMNASTKKPNAHAGHRSRFKERFVQEGLEHFELHNVLEILLYFGIPQKDTNELAHTLMETFGGFSQVFLADIEQLEAIKGMTRNAAILIKLVPQVYRKVMEDDSDREQYLENADKIRHFLQPRFIGRAEETVYLLCMNNACKLLRAEIISTGTKSMAHIDTRKLVETVIQCGAVSVVLAHNHPHGVARPSQNDVLTTKRMEKVLIQLGIELLDHFIVAQGECVSMMEMGFLSVKNIVDIDLPQVEDLKQF